MSQPHLSPKQQIIKLLPLLSTTEKGEVRGAMKAGEAFGGVPGADSEMGRDWLLQGIASFLVKHGYAPADKSVYTWMRKKDAYKTYQAKLPGAMAFLEGVERGFPHHERLRPKLAYLCAQALAEMMGRRGYFSVNGMFTNIDKIPEALDEAFPGYAQAGMLKFVLEAGA